MKDSRVIRPVRKSAGLLFAAFFAVALAACKDDARKAGENRPASQASSEQRATKADKARSAAENAMNAAKTAVDTAAGKIGEAVGNGMDETRDATSAIVNREQRMGAGDSGTVPNTQKDATHQ